MRRRTTSTSGTSGTACRGHDAILAAIKRGYAWVGQNERGRYFSEGKYETLGEPMTDGYETIDYLTEAAVVERQGGHDRMLVTESGSRPSPRWGIPALRP